MGGRRNLDSGRSEADIHQAETEGAGNRGRRNRRGGGGFVGTHHTDRQGSENTRQPALPSCPEEAAAAAIEMSRERQQGVLHATGLGVGVQTKPVLRGQELGD